MIFVLLILNNILDYFFVVFFLNFGFMYILEYVFFICDVIV